MTPQNPTAIHVTLDQEEWTVLSQILEQALTDIHVERRRTEDPTYHEEIVHREGVLRALLERVRQAHP
jgi:hypothetical protein